MFGVLVSVSPERSDADKNPRRPNFRFLVVSLVVIFFMGVRYNTPLTKVVVVAGFFWLLIMITMSLSDYATRWFVP